MRPWVVLALVTGCNQVYGLDSTQLAPDADERPDIDNDGIADVEDPCLSSEADRVHDLDQDGVLDGSDRCIFLPNDGDSDADGVPDACDPFLTLAGDRVRCTTSFQSRELSSLIWRPRTGEDELLTGTGQLFATGMGEGIATPGMLGTAPSIAVDVAVRAAYVQLPFRFGMWLSALPEPSMNDVGCVIVSDGTQAQLEFVAPVRTSSPSSPSPRIQDPRADAANIGIRAYVQPSQSGTNVACFATYQSPTGMELLTVRGHVDAPLGAFGFVVRRGLVSVIGLAIFERDSAPALP